MNADEIKNRLIESLHKAKSREAKRERDERMKTLFPLSVIEIEILLSALEEDE